MKLEKTVKLTPLFFGVQNLNLERLIAELNRNKIPIDEGASRIIHISHERKYPDIALHLGESLPKLPENSSHEEVDKAFSYFHTCYMLQSYPRDMLIHISDPLNLKERFTKYRIRFNGSEQRSGLVEVATEIIKKEHERSHQDKVEEFKITMEEVAESNRRLRDSQRGPIPNYFIGAAR